MDQKRIKQLHSFEAVIKKQQSNFHVLGKTLSKIKDLSLYKHIGFKSFEDYTIKRLDIKKSQAYRMINASKVIENLSPIGDILPQNEAQARLLTKFDTFTQQQLWQKFLETGMALTTSNIRKSIINQNNKSQTILSSRIEQISDAYKAKVDDMLYQVRLEQNDNWQTTSKEAALHWNKIIKEKILWKN
ncbi:MAG: DNA modification methylase family protein [Candidatus Magnetoglobus multicellularis str. Araruama]|uniref:DNA modification methylase family protein n=1 Tax=Candidatus Magnetoglobus multicellularis str. Araruama TaxID=890399 RepID=A0A1V1P3G7_9BACT|nr:MAG: DNA modification methylase family protein [Candidatus Magnetoglobus multicellularis str. Araruama]